MLCIGRPNGNIYRLPATCELYGTLDLYILLCIAILSYEGFKCLLAHTLFGRVFSLSLAINIIENSFWLDDFLLAIILHFSSPL